MVFVLALLACEESSPTDAATASQAQASPLTWEVHEIDCGAEGSYRVPSPTSALAAYTVYEHILNSQGESRVKSLIEQVNELSTDTETWDRACDSGGGYLLVVTYAYPAE